MIPTEPDMEQVEPGTSRIRERATAIFDTKAAGVVLVFDAEGSCDQTSGEVSVFQLAMALCAYAANLINLGLQGDDAPQEPEA